MISDQIANRGEVPHTGRRSAIIGHTRPTETPVAFIRHRNCGLVGADIKPAIQDQDRLLYRRPVWLCSFAYTILMVLTQA